MEVPRLLDQEGEVTAMAENTKIEWTDHSFNPWMGCAHATIPGTTLQHPGCLNCYAEAGAKRNPDALGKWGDDGFRVKSKSFLANMRRANARAEKTGVRERVFPSFCDPFEDRPELVEWRREMFAVVDECPNIDLLLLTKRPQNIPKFWSSHPRFPVNEDLVGRTIESLVQTGESELVRECFHRSNVWLGCSVSNQLTANVLIPLLSRCVNLSPVLFLSIEPLLGPIDLLAVGNHNGTRANWFDGNCLYVGQIGGDEYFGTPSGLIRWAIIGGESGAHARPCDLRWIRNLTEELKEAKVATFVKQVGSMAVNGSQRIHTDHPKGGDPAEWPEDLRIREFPTV